MSNENDKLFKLTHNEKVKNKIKTLKKVKKVLDKRTKL